jgi:hypothetical protein
LEPRDFALGKIEAHLYRSLNFRWRNYGTVKLKMRAFSMLIVALNLRMAEFWGCETDITEGE